jgi:hypothetical protein
MDIKEKTIYIRVEIPIYEIIIIELKISRV